MPLLMQLHLCVEVHLCTSPQVDQTGGAVCLIVRCLLEQNACKLHPCLVSMLCQSAILHAGTVTLPAGIEMVMPGDNVTADFELIAPVAMEPGLRFALREGGRTVGAGVVSEVV